MTLNIKLNTKKESTSIFKSTELKEKLLNFRHFQEYKLEACTKIKLIEDENIPKNLSLNGFVEAIHLAYSEHIGLTLSPEQFFILVLQGLSIHVNLNPKKHANVLGLDEKVLENKIEINIERPEFRIGKDNDWENTFPEFSQQISNHIKSDIYDLFSTTFSTSTSLSNAVSSLCLMNITKAYFEFSVTTMCGIPEIELSGTKEDWEKLYWRVKELLSKFKDIEFWSIQLLPILKQIYETFDAPKYEQVTFWSSIYKTDGGSGGPFINGWISVFFPYITCYDGIKVNYRLDWQNSKYSGLTFDKFPVSFSKTPFTWNYFKERHKMIFIGGFLGSETCPNNFISPSIGWSVFYEA